MITETRQRSETGSTSRSSTEPRDLKALFRTLADDASRWMRQEVELAKAELSRTVHETTRQAARMAAGIVALASGAMVLLLAVSAGVAALLVQAGLAPTVAVFLGLLIVGALVSLGGFLLFQHSKKQLSAENLKPQKTAESLIATKNWAQSKIP